MSVPDVYSAVRWSAVAKYGAQAVDFVTSIIIARLVMPEAYGLLGMALVGVGFVSVLQGLGFGTAIIRRKRLSQGLLSTLFFANLAFSGILAVAVLATAPLFATLYAEPRVKAIMVVLTFPFLCTSCTTVPNALLTRKLRFRALAIVDLFAALARLATGVTLAYYGWEVWALVAASVVSSVIQATGNWLCAAWVPRLWFRWQHLLNVLEFSGSLTATYLVIYFSRSGIDFLVGKFLGPSALGLLSIASRIMLFPREAIADVVMRVFFPVFSKLQDDPRALSATYIRVLSAVAFLAFPSVAGAAVLSPLLVDVLLGTKWEPAVPLMLSLCCLGGIYPLLVPTMGVLLAKGRAKVVLALEVTRAALTIAAVVIACQWDVAAVATAWTVSNVMMLMPIYISLARTLAPLKVGAVLKGLWPYLFGSVVMAIVVRLGEVSLSSASLPGLGRLVVLVATGVVAYIVVVMILRAPMVNYLRRLIGFPEATTW